MDEPRPRGIDFGRNLYEVTRHWYDRADAKAQVLVTLNGVLVAFLTTGLLTGEAALLAILDEVGVVLVLGVGGLALAIAASLGSALACLRSRASPRGVDFPVVEHVAVPPEESLYFGAIAALAPDQLPALLRSVDDDYELEALGRQVHLLAGNVAAKHRWVNRGFLSLTIGLVLLLATVFTYVLALWRG